MPPLPDRWLRNVPTRDCTSWRIGGPARYLSQPRNEDELRADLELARDHRLPTFAIGAGSNLLFPDDGYPGLLIRQAAPAEIAFEEIDAGILRLPAGAALPPLVRHLASRGWGGLEWAEGIPGTVGGAVVCNAGAYGGAITDLLSSAHLLTAEGREETWSQERFAYGYRSSALKGQEPSTRFILSADLRLARDDPAHIDERIARHHRIRRDRTPAGASCGSVFRNPPHQSAGRLIAEAGLGGTRLGGAEISAKHANYILNRDRASAADVLALIERCRQEVAARTGIELELEVQLVGFELH